MPAPTQSQYKVVLTFFALVSIALFTSCQPNVSDKRKDTSAPTVSPTASKSATPVFQATFTQLPGDIYFLYQTQTAAPTKYPRILWQPTEGYQTATPQYTLTALVIQTTKTLCLLAYPDFCVSPDVRLGCTALLNLGKHDFTVLAPDPYGYDKDGDGIGCDTEK